METPDLGDGGGNRPILDGLDLTFIYLDALGRDHITQKDNLRSDKSDTSLGCRIAFLETTLVGLVGGGRHTPFLPYYR